MGGNHGLALTVFAGKLTLPLVSPTKAEDRLSLATHWPSRRSCGGMVAGAGTGCTEHKHMGHMNHKRSAPVKNKFEK